MESLILLHKDQISVVFDPKARAYVPGLVEDIEDKSDPGHYWVKGGLRVLGSSLRSPTEAYNRADDALSVLKARSDAEARESRKAGEEAKPS